MFGFLLARFGAVKHGSTADRSAAIMQRLRDDLFLTVADLARGIGVSDMTIRRDLARLDEAGEVQLVHGGVRLPAPGRGEMAFGPRALRHKAAKQAIGRLAASLVAPDETIAIDAGTTAYHLAGALDAGFQGSIATHSVPVIAALLEAGRFRVIALGGDLLVDSAAFVGPFSIEAAQRLRVRSFFLGAAAIDARGVYVAADIERPTKRALMEIADRIILLADHSKFQLSAPVRLCGLDEIDILVTDQLPLALKSACVRNNVKPMMTALQGNRVRR